MTAMQRRLVSLFVALLSAAVALGGYAWLRQRERTAEAEASRDEKVMRFDSPADVKEVVVTSLDTGRVRLVRGGEGAWRMSAPVDTPADAGVVHAFLEHLAGLRREGRVEAAQREDGLAAFGLERPRFTVVVHLAAGGVDHLQVGSKNDFNGQLYVMNRAEAADARAAAPIYMVPASLEYQVDKDVLAWREKRLAVFEPSQVASIAVRVPQAEQPFLSHYLVERREGAWWVAEPKALPGDPSVLEELARALSQLRAAAFLSDAASPASVGSLAQSATGSVTVTLGDGARLVYHVREEKDGTATVALERDGVADPRVMRAAGGSPVGRVRATLWDLRDKRVLRVKAQDVRGVVMKHGDEHVVLEKRTDPEHAADPWYATAPESVKAQDATVAGLLYGLEHLEGTRVVYEAASAGELSEAGLAAPRLIVSLTAEDGAALGELLVGHVRDGLAMVRAAGSTLVMAVDEARVQDVLAAMKDYPERGTATSAP